MKIIKFVTLCALLVVALYISASFSPPVSSWYNAAPSSETGLSLYAPNPSYFGTFNFDTNMNGFYNLTDATFTTSYSGLVKLSGTCSQSKPNHVALALIAYSYAYPLVDTSDAVFSFSYAFPASTLQIRAMTYAIGQYDLLKCNLLFEQVK